MAQPPSVPGPLHYRGITITLKTRANSVRFLCRNDQPDAETTCNTHKRQTSTPPTGFEPRVPASERTQTHGLDCAATGIDKSLSYKSKLVRSDDKICVYLLLKIILKSAFNEFDLTCAQYIRSKKGHLREGYKYVSVELCVCMPNHVG